MECTKRPLNVGRCPSINFAHDKCVDNECVISYVIGWETMKNTTADQREYFHLSSSFIIPVRAIFLIMANVRNACVHVVYLPATVTSCTTKKTKSQVCFIVFAVAAM